MLTGGTEIRVVDQQTGDLLRDLTLDTTHDYQRQKWKNTLKPWVQSIPMSCDMTKCPQQELNLRPSAPEADALSPELWGL